MYVCSSSTGRALIAKNFKVVEFYVKKSGTNQKDLKYVPFLAKTFLYLDLTFFVNSFI